MFRSIATLFATLACTVALGLCCTIEQEQVSGMHSHLQDKALITKNETYTPENIYIPEKARLAATYARENLALRQKVELDDVQLVAITHVDWRDSSLGCPSPGQMYAQVITPGYRILLSSKNSLWEYHAAENAATAIFCGPSDNMVNPPIHILCSLI